MTVNGLNISADYFRKYFENQQPENMNAKQQAQALDELIKIKLLSSLAKEQKLMDLYEVKLALQVKQDEYLTNLMLSKYLQENPITTSDIDQVYQEKYADNNFEYHLFHILVKQQQQAQVIIEKLRSGADFATLANTESLDSGTQGGDLGWLGKESIPVSFQSALKQLQPNRVHSTAVSSDYGWHVLKLADKRAVPAMPLAQVSEDITHLLQKNKINHYLNQLREKAHIQFNPELMKASQH